MTPPFLREGGAPWCTSAPNQAHAINTNFGCNESFKVSHKFLRVHVDNQDEGDVHHLTELPAWEIISQNADSA